MPCPPGSYSPSFLLLLVNPLPLRGRVPCMRSHDFLTPYTVPSRFTRTPRLLLPHPRAQVRPRPGLLLPLRGGAGGGQRPRAVPPQPGGGPLHGAHTHHLARQQRMRWVGVAVGEGKAGGQVQSGQATETECSRAWIVRRLRKQVQLREGGGAWSNRGDGGAEERRRMAAAGRGWAGKRVDGRR